MISLRNPVFSDTSGGSGLRVLARSAGDPVLRVFRGALGRLSLRRPPVGHSVPTSVDWSDDRSVDREECVGVQGVRSSQQRLG